MTLYEEELPSEYFGLNLDLEKYLVDIPVKCPYGLGFTAIYRQALFGPLPDELFEYFLKSGFRRNGNCLYSMACRDCNDCISIRLHPEEFEPNRNQKRVLKKNRDVIVKIEALQFTEEKMALCNKFLSRRYPGRGNTAEDYYAGFFINNITSTFEVQYLIDNRLLGVAIIDLGRNWVNAVYFYFDPDEEGRSPGTFNILNLINFCRDAGVRNLYLGYWINDVTSMNYKANFRPNYLLAGGKWLSSEDFGAKGIKLRGYGAAETVTARGRIRQDRR